MKDGLIGGTKEDYISILKEGKDDGKIVQRDPKVHFIKDTGIRNRV